MPPRAKKPVTPPEPEFDPFNEPGQDNVPDGDEAQTEMPPPWEVSDETDVNSTDTEKKAVVNVSAESKIVVTIKGGRDYDEPWVVIHADDLDDALSQTTDKAKLGDLMKAAQEASKAFRDFRPTEDKGNRGSGSQSGSQGQGDRTQGKPAAASAHPSGRQEFCQHGEMKWVTGLSQKTQKLWGAFDCATDPKNCPKGRVWDNNFGK